MPFWVYRRSGAMTDTSAEQWLAEIAASGGWSPRGIEVLRAKLDAYGLDWVLANEPKMQQFAKTADNSALVLHAFDAMTGEEIEAAQAGWVESWKPSSETGWASSARASRTMSCAALPHDHRPPVRARARGARDEDRHALAARCRSAPRSPPKVLTDAVPPAQAQRAL